MKPIVTENGIITTDEPLFMCCWNGDDYQIHTRATLWENFKDTNLFDADEDGWCVKANFSMLLERLQLELDFTTYHNDNMSIKRIK